MGLTIKGLSVAGKILKHKPFTDAADKAIQFIRDKLYADGQLYATWQSGKPKIGAFWMIMRLCGWGFNAY